MGSARAQACEHEACVWPEWRWISPGGGPSMRTRHCEGVEGCRRPVSVPRNFGRCKRAAHKQLLYHAEEFRLKITTAQKERTELSELHPFRFLTRGVEHRRTFRVARARRHRAPTPMLAAFSGLVASGLLTCASQAHGALRAVPLAAHTSRARPIRCAQDDDIAFSRRKMEATLAEARYEVSRQLEAQADQKSSGACEIMPTLLKQSIVGYQLVWTLGALLLASEIFARLAHVPPPVVSLLDAQLVLNGVLVGLPSAVLVSRLERWRLDGAAAVSAPPSSSSATPPRLTQFATPTLQLVFLPVRPFFPLFVETSGTEVIEQQPAMTATTLLGGTLVGSAWTHGLLQVGWKAFLANAALQLAGTSADLAEGAQAVTAFGEDVMAALAGSNPNPKPIPTPNPNPNPNPSPHPNPNPNQGGARGFGRRLAAPARPSQPLRDRSGPDRRSVGGGGGSCRG